MQTLLETFKHHDQITRYCLIGSGIVSGLELFVDQDNYIRVTSGTGLTSDGTYVEVSGQQSFWFYRPYKTQGPYPLFKYETWQLVRRDDFHEGDKSLKPQSSQQQLNPFLLDKIVVLYLENNFGKEDIYPQFKLKFLLIRQDDLLQLLKLDKIMTRLLWERLEDDEDYIYSDTFVKEQPEMEDLNKAANPALRLEEISLLRFGFAPGNPFACPPEGDDTSVFPQVSCLDDLYDGNEDGAGENIGASGYVQVIDKAVDDLLEQLEKLKIFHHLLGNLRGWDLQDTLSKLQEKWDAYKAKNRDEDVTKHKKEYVQYFYDWMRDLINGYHELRRELIDLVAETFPDINEYPRHLLLGLAVRGNIVNTPQPLRHHFQQPPIYNGNAARLEKIKLYFWRLQMMVKGFYLPDYIPPKLYKTCNPIKEDEVGLDFNIIKITPGKFYDHPLSDQTIPYYYPVLDHRHSVHNFWNHHRTKTSTTNHILSYHANDAEDTYSDLPQVTHALHYNLDEYDFYRIEGHIGHPLLETFILKVKEEEITIHDGVKDYLHYLIEKYNLDFEVFAIELEKDYKLITLDRDDMYVEELDDFPRKYNFWSPQKHLLGMEHLGGVKKGGTFVLVYENMPISIDENGSVLEWKEWVVADFSLPFRLSTYEAELAEGIISRLDSSENEQQALKMNLEDIQHKLMKTRTELDEVNVALEETNQKINLHLKLHGKKDAEILKDEFLERIGKGKEGDKAVSEVTGIGPKMVEYLSKAGIKTVNQLSKVRDEDWELVDSLAEKKISTKARKEDWISGAKKKLKDK